MNKIYLLLGCITFFLFIIFFYNLNNYQELERRYNVDFNNCLMDYGANFCEDRNLHLNDINLITENIDFICIDVKSKEKIWFHFPREVLNKCFDKIKSGVLKE